MRVLLDECVPRRLKGELIGHFEVFLTVDRKLQHQQNVTEFDIAVLVLVATGNTLADLRPLMPEVLNVLPTAPRGAVTMVGSRG